jgi:hypothetical protein
MQKIIFMLVILIAARVYGQVVPAKTVPGNVPIELITNDSTYWTISTLSSVNYVNTTPGANYGTTTSGGGMLVKFKFLPNNRFKFQLYVETNTYNLHNTAWTETEGTVTFIKDAKGQDILITKAAKGIYRTMRSGIASSRPIPKEELQGQHSSSYLWQKTMFKDDPDNVYLLMVDLEKYPNADVNTAGTIKPEWVSKFHIPVKK